MGKRTLVLLALLVGACAPTVDNSKSGPYPDNYRQLVAAHVRQNFFDPYSIRDASVSEPVKGAMNVVGKPAWTPAQQGWLVCLRVNAKNRMGGYTGLSTTGYLISNGAIVDSDEQPGPVCDARTFLPWPELEIAGKLGGYPGAAPSQHVRLGLIAPYVPPWPYYEGVGLKNGHGVVVNGVQPGSAAAQAGLKSRDIILAFGGEQVDSVEQLQKLVEQAPARTPVAVQVWRDRAQADLSIVFSSAP